MIETKFKNSEIGLIPEDWEVFTLGSQCSINGRIGFRGYTTADLVKKGEGAISLSPSNINNSTLDYNNSTYISLYKYEESPEIKVFNGDILFCKTASIGKCAFVENLTELATINPQFVVLKNFKCDSKYLFQTIIGNQFQKGIKEIVVGSTIPTLSQEKFKCQYISIPSLSEQRRIAQALSNVDSLILSLDKLIEKKKAIKQGAMQQLLTGKKRLKGFNEPWVERKLGEICLITMGQSPSSTYYNVNKQGIPLIQGNADIGDDRKQIIRFYTTKETKICPQGAIIMTVRAPVGSIGKATIKSCIGRGVCSIIFQNEYLFQYLIFIENSWSKLSSGSTFDSINGIELKNVLITLPKSDKEQTAIADILTKMDKDIVALEQKRAKYESIKQGMMQQLLTGKIRLI